MSARAQTFTLEAFVAAILLLAALAFSLHAVAVSPNTAGAAGAETQSQHVGIASGLLDEAAANGTLQKTLLYWDQNNTMFYEADLEPDEGGHYIGQLPQSQSAPVFGNRTAEMFADRRVRYNIDLVYRTENGTRGRKRLVESGTPSDDAVRVVQTVTLYNDTQVLNASGEANATLAEIQAGPGRFYAPDAVPGSPLYNVIRVEVVLWQT